jgi:hypothetical protein
MPVFYGKDLLALSDFPRRRALLFSCSWLLIRYFRKQPASWRPSSETRTFRGGKGPKPNLLIMFFALAVDILITRLSKTPTLRDSSNVAERIYGTQIDTHVPSQLPILAAGSWVLPTDLVSDMPT